MMIGTKEPETLCDSCKDKEICGSNSRELICSEDLNKLKNNGIKAKAVVYRCASYKEELKT